jgi:DNA-binding NarL/FixJ family response regulator
MKLLLADDHTLFRDALVHYIRRAEPDACVLVAKDIAEAMKIMAEQDILPDLVMLDYLMPGMNGLKGLAEMRAAYPDVPAVLMSGIASGKTVDDALEMGAMGFFPKTLSGKALLGAIQVVLAGERYLPIERESNEVMPSYYGVLEDIIDSPPPREAVSAPYEIEASTANGYSLTDREREVLSHLLGGVSNKEIARALDLQVVTVKLHVRGICRKLGAKNRTQAALMARDQKVVHPVETR